MDEFFITLADNKGYPYKGRANWIWAQEKYGKFFSTGVLAKVINIDSSRKGPLHGGPFYYFVI